MVQITFLEQKTAKAELKSTQLTAFPHSLGGGFNWWVQHFNL
jgi:hypothetical protein